MRITVLIYYDALAENVKYSVLLARRELNVGGCCKLVLDIGMIML